ncbi:MAG: DUF3536 domain-containing protein, partial [Candidatus Omnitrophica bacterium]|nr:DUF3536 domain-containing protein [Candidatus Omnitrophota bacterium]
MSKLSALSIHGHFYQPPRENPWIEDIEIQASARPYHDWNERIYHECYLPNTRARILDEKGRITDIVNNFEKISFNVGPTLFSWIESKHPDVYRDIVKSDETSRAKHKGHGNAIAQVYNHMIMPLATREDKVTQVRWGIEEFRHRFNRDPEGMWLPETACDEETLDVLIEYGVKFTILSPFQAQAVRSLGHVMAPNERAHWEDVSHGTINTKMPYRCFIGKGSEKHIDLFFYDGPVARDLAFGSLAFEAHLFADSLEGARNTNSLDAELVHVATDGETFGHHKAFGERALAYLLHVEAEKRGFRIMNYGEFLESHPPKYEVQIQKGIDGDGMSWSCAHGIRRWKEHCGCRTGGPAEWNQHWRKPLRRSLDWLRDELREIYETHASRYLKDVWEARSDYIKVILDRSEKSRWDFFARHAKRELSTSEVITCYHLLEMERHAMLMYTSCGWFFTELSGIETVQILQYASRALRLARGITQESLEEKFVELLSDAKSNVPEFKDGRGVYEALVKPAAVSMRRIVSHYAIGSIFDGYYPDQEELPIYCFKLHILHHQKESAGNVTLNFGIVRVTSEVTLEENEYVFIALQVGLYDFRCSVKPFSEPAALARIERELFDELHSAHVVELMRKIDRHFGHNYFALKDLLLTDRMKIISILTREIIEKIESVYENLYDEHRKMNQAYRSIHLPIPEPVQYAAQHTLGRRLRDAVYDLAHANFNPKKSTPIYKIMEAAKLF